MAVDPGRLQPGTDHDGPLPSESSPFSFSCACLNLRIHGSVQGDPPVTSEPREGGPSRLRRVWFAQHPEDIASPVIDQLGAHQQTLPDFVSYDQNVLSTNDEETAGGQDDGFDTNTLGPSWRTCWLCGVKCYQVAGKRRSDPAVKEGWVEVDLGSGILSGDQVDHLVSTSDPSNSLTFSKLRLTNPASFSSTFGRPPSQDRPSIYPSQTSRSPLLPHVADPFFLPPPFIPSDPVLRNLCEQAVTYLQDTHQQLERQIQTYITLRAQELRRREDEVRAEVEMLWKMYQEIPGNELRARSGSVSRVASRTKSPARRQTFSPTPSSTNPSSPMPSNVLSSPNPILREAATSPAFPGSSLLSQSMSFNTYASPPMTPKTDDAIEKVERTVRKTADARAVAMSYVFSSLDERMGRGPAAAPDVNPKQEDLEEILEEATSSDSWIDAERAEAKRLEVAAGVDEGRTPRAEGPKELHEVSEKSKGKRVQFEERDGSEGDGVGDPEDGVIDQDDYVFDFELAEPSSAPVDTSRTAKNMVEASLSATFAADAPSHRAAWRRLEESGSMASVLRRESASFAESPTDETSISNFATSMPIAIMTPKAAQNLNLEPKTSLVDRKGVLVPPLLNAMREKGVDKNALGIGMTDGERPGRTGERKGSRSTSVSRERETSRTYTRKADLGAVFESLADEDGEDANERRGQAGTLKERSFVPPHVSAQRASTDS